MRTCARKGLSLVAALSAVCAGALWFGALSAFATGDANQSACPASSESSPGFRSYLPDCRAYELVSPPYRDGGVLLAEAAALAIAPSGEDMVIGLGGATGSAGNSSFDANRGGVLDVYHVERTEGGWQYTPLTPPAVPYTRSSLMAVSADATLGTTLWGAQTQDTRYHEESVYIQSGDSGLMPVGPGLAPGFVGHADNSTNHELGLVGASADLTRSVFSIEGGTSEGHSDLWSGDTTRSGGESLYEYVYRGASSSEPLLVGVKNHGALANNEQAQLISDCGTTLGGGQGSVYNAVSEDGEAVFFTANACGSSPTVNELYARIGGAETVAISEPSKAACEACNTTSGLQNATFVGASQDGSKVFFMTEQELLPGQAGMNLYEYDFDGPSASASDPDGKIALVSSGAASPGVQGVARISEDGSHVYFVATGVLTSGPNAEGAEPEAEADNLYVDEPDPAHSGADRVVFVAKLLTKAQEAALEGEEAAESVLVAERAEQVEFAAFDGALGAGASFEEAFAQATAAYQQALLTLPGSLGTTGTLFTDRGVWKREDQRPVQATPDGGVLVFTSSAHLTANDTSTVPQVFEYDATTERLKRISIGQGEAYDDDGAASVFNDAPRLPAPAFAGTDLPSAAGAHNALSAGGAEVFFVSAAPLTPTAVSGAPSVFEYRGGEIYLVSDGQDAADAGVGTPAVGLIGADASGRDVFFSTSDQLVPQAGDTQQALYDAREGGGFPAPTLAPGCVGETCRGVSAAAPELPAAASSTEGAGDNLTPAPVVSKPVSTRGKPLSRAQRLKKALSACARLPRKRRAQCRAQARKRYGPRSAASHASRASARATGNQHGKGRNK